LALLALVQIVVHFRFFMHIDLRKSHRDDLQLILFTALIIGLMVGGTIWILASQHARM
jgi:cytochrome o ubiquinol oxidase operon protein cyoD